MQLEIMNYSIPKGDILIYPELKMINPLSFDDLEEVIEAGRRAAWDVMDKLKSTLNLNSKKDDTSL